ncbi:MAG: type II toxin-antitoxin system VapC family toxin [Chloroflexi bacterium]|nr:type II toxin-antitoxin system VapC family toxin [Chloroflexota bacterium]
MAIYFMDTSAVVKRFHNEIGSSWVRNIFAASVSDEDGASEIIHASALTLVEVPAAFAILERTHEITTALRDELFQAFITSRQAELEIVPITNAILLDAAALTQKHPLKAYDAVQLASALDLQNALREFEVPLVFVTSAKQLGQAAQTEGLLVENPLWHPDTLPPTQETPSA